MYGSAVHFLDKTGMAQRNFEFYFTRLEVLVEDFMASGSSNKTAFNKTELRATGTGSRQPYSREHETR